VAAVGLDEMLVRLMRLAVDLAASAENASMRLERFSGASPTEARRLLT
jgi:hypothetical protein